MSALYAVKYVRRHPNMNDKIQFTMYSATRLVYGRVSTRLSVDHAGPHDQLYHTANHRLFVVFRPTMIPRDPTGGGLAYDSLSLVSLSVSRALSCHTSPTESRQLCLPKT